MESLDKEVSAEIENNVLSAQHPERVYFIAHSLGGIVIRRYLTHVVERYGHRELSRYRLTFLMGTPSNGSTLAEVLEHLSFSHLIPILTPAQHDAFLGFLNGGFEDIVAKHNGSFCPSIAFAAGVEGEPYGETVIVNQQSAEIGATIVRKFDDKNHLSLVKPSTRSDHVYQWVSNNIQACTAGKANKDDNKIACPPKRMNPGCTDTASPPWPSLGY